MTRLMVHAAGSTGLSLTAAADPDRPKAGEFVHLASRDESAPAGCLRVFLQDVEGVRRLYAALHGQAVRVNGDYIYVRVTNDAMTLEAASGKDPRARS